MSPQPWNVAIFRHDTIMDDRAMFGDWSTTRDLALEQANELNRWCLTSSISGRYIAYPVPFAG